MTDPQENGPRLTRSCFVLDLRDGTLPVPFEEVSGLDGAAQVIEYRSGAEPALSQTPVPGPIGRGNITLKHGVLSGRSSFFDEMSAAVDNTVRPRTVEIRLLNEAGDAVMTWTLGGAWATKISRAELPSGGGDTAIESLELAFGTLTQAAG